MNVPLQELSRLVDEGWLVGGAVRDRLLGRPTEDFDIAVAGDAQPLARRLARAAHAHAFELSEGFGAWRVTARDRTWQIDVLPLTGETIEADLRRRDFTVNAIAEPLGGGDFVDPLGGLRDIRLRRLRMVSPQAFAADPLRSLRLARLACELDFEAEPETASAARAQAPALAGVAAERIFAEIKRIVIADRALDGLGLMDALGVTDVVLPELTRLQGVRAEPLPPPRRPSPHAGGPCRDDRARARPGALAGGARAGGRGAARRAAGERAHARAGASLRCLVSRRGKATDAQRDLGGAGHVHGP